MAEHLDILSHWGPSLPLRLWAHPQGICVVNLEEDSVEQAGGLLGVDRDGVVVGGIILLNPEPMKYVRVLPIGLGIRRPLNLLGQ